MQWDISKLVRLTKMGGSSIKAAAFQKFPSLLIHQMTESSAEMADAIIAERLRWRTLRNSVLSGGKVTPKPEKTSSKQASRKVASRGFVSRFASHKGTGTSRQSSQKRESSSKGSQSVFGLPAIFGTGASARGESRKSNGSSTKPAARSESFRGRSGSTNFKDVAAVVKTMLTGVQTESDSAAIDARINDTSERIRSIQVSPASRKTR
jgi:hypothetical protein